MHDGNDFFFDGSCSYGSCGNAAVSWALTTLSSVASRNWSVKKIRRTMKAPTHVTARTVINRFRHPRLAVSFSAQDAPSSAVQPGDTTTRNPSGTPGEEKSAAGEDNRNGNASRNRGIVDDIGPSSANPGEPNSAAGAGAGSTRGLASAVIDKPSEPHGGQPGVTAGAPTTHVVVGSAAVAAAALGVGSAANNRRPSSTLAWQLVLQVQFLAILSLVDSVGSGSSWLPSILREMR